MLNYESIMTLLEINQRIRPFLEECCTRVPERSRNFVCASDRSGKDSQALFIPWKSKLQ